MRANIDKIMKKLLFTLLLCIASCVSTYAIPAYPYPVKLTMPDGSTLTIVGHGDEFRHYVTTLDGYTIVRGEDQFYRYAKIENGELVPTAMLAHDEGLRNTVEKEFLMQQAKYLIPSRETKRMVRLQETEQVQRRITGNENYKGLVVLVNYSDRSFRLGANAAQAHFNDMMNAENWTSYQDLGRTFRVTGSVRDYFRDNSYGKFNPTFDVVGPVDINYSSTYCRGGDNMSSILNSVITKIDSSVDFSKYDSDGDGSVDMIYFIFAGYPSSNSGNNENYLWPHASDLGYYISSRKDGKYLGRYACSTELYGWENYGNTELNGIGVICHEFSHVLGYMDHYDVNYGGHEMPGNWDVMSGGSYNGDYMSCPAGYNAYERYAAGFLAPTVISKTNDGETITLENIQENQSACLIKTPVSKEYFLLENRQKVKWDASLPGHGMLVWRVDSTNANRWYYNQVNSTDHPYFQLIRAGGWKGDGKDGQADPFPGSKGVTSITNETTPASLLTYSKRTNDISLKRIRENSGVITFVVQTDGSNIQEDNDLPEGVIFYESFNGCVGVGGNDNIWNSSQKPDVFLADNEDWSYKTVAGLNQCARFGSSAATRESVLTPTIKIEAGHYYELAFKASPFATDGQSWTLSVNSGNAILKNLADEAQEPATSVTFKMERNKWNDLSFLVTGSGAQVFKFYGATSVSKRIVLDEVYVYDRTEEFVDGISLQPMTSAQDDAWYDLTGRVVTLPTHGVYIHNGQKVLVK